MEIPIEKPGVITNTDSSSSPRSGKRIFALPEITSRAESLTVSPLLMDRVQCEVYIYVCTIFTVSLNICTIFTVSLSLFYLIYNNLHVCTIFTVSLSLFDLTLYKFISLHDFYSVTFSVLFDI